MRIENVNSVEINRFTCEGMNHLENVNCEKMNRVKNPLVKKWVIWKCDESCEKILWINWSMWRWRKREKKSHVKEWIVLKWRNCFFFLKINGRNYFKRESCEKITCEELNHMEINGSCGEKKKESYSMKNRNMWIVRILIDLHVKEWIVKMNYVKNWIIWKEPNHMKRNESRERSHVENKWIVKISHVRKHICESCESFSVRAHRRR